MRGIQAAFTGKIGQGPELKTSKAGKPWLSFNVAVDETSEEAPHWVRVAVFGERATEVVTQGLQKGAEVYVEGRLRLESWAGKDGRERTGLSVAASRVDVLGRIGVDPYQRKPTEAPVAHHEFEGQGRTEQDLPF